jgi:hypothetical protein
MVVGRMVARVTVGGAERRLDNRSLAILNCQLDAGVVSRGKRAVAFGRKSAMEECTESSMRNMGDPAKVLRAVDGGASPEIGAAEALVRVTKTPIHPTNELSTRGWSIPVSG